MRSCMFVKKLKNFTNKSMLNDLKNLSDPLKYSKLINVKGMKKKDLKIFLQNMMLIRNTENKVAHLVKNKVINCPAHLCTGQEAISVGVLSNCRKGDMVYGNHRSHGHYLALGGDIKKLFLELQGKPQGCSKGMGGSMHIVDRSVGFEGSVPIVAGTIPIAVGAALKSKLKQDKTISIAFFGDGACEEGSFHECLNFSSLHSLPIIFVAENNLFSSHLDIHLRQPSNRLARYAEAHKIKNFTVDGNDVVKVFKTIKNNMNKLRNGKGPLFIECISYRHLGHVGHDENVDVGVNRTLKDLKNWKKNDPILRLSRSLNKKKIFSKKYIENLDFKINQKVEQFYKYSKKIKLIKNKKIKEYIY